MAEIKPSEVTAILRQQISGMNLGVNMEETGTVLEIGDGIARVYGLGNARAGEMVEFEKTGLKGIVLNLETDNVGIVLLGDTQSLNEGDVVKRTGILLNKVGEGLLGRVINTIENPLTARSNRRRIIRNAIGTQGSV